MKLEFCYIIIFLAISFYYIFIFLFNQLHPSNRHDHQSPYTLIIIMIIIIFPKSIIIMTFIITIMHIEY